jgi:quinol monooxygenase YgiN
MAKVLLSIRYEIESSRRDEYLSVIRELKSVLKTDGLESYSVFEIKGKPNNFEEIYTYSSEQAYEEADDSDNERINILIDKITEMSVDNSTKYTTLYELSEN